MFVNQEVKSQIAREQKYARQFIIAIVMILLVSFNIGLYMVVRLKEMGMSLPNSYIIQAVFIPAMLALMAIYYFRLHRKNIKRIREEADAEKE